MQDRYGGRGPGSRSGPPGPPRGPGQPQGLGPPQFRVPPELSQRTTGFYDVDGHLDPELVSAVAQDLGKRFCEARLTTGQIRKYYGDLKSLESEIKQALLGGQSDQRLTSNEPAELRPHLAQVKMIKAKAAYGLRREGTASIPREFAGMLAWCVDHVETPLDVQSFVDFFQAVVGYYYWAGGQ